MKLFEQLTEQLFTLKSILEELNEEQFTYPCAYLSHATIGGHTRHIIELLKCATDGYQRGNIDYTNRSRNLILEQNKNAAIAETNNLLHSVIQLNKEVEVATDDGSIKSNYYREILYHVDHTVHHLALIKVSLLDQNIQVTNKNLGMAYSTIRYQQQTGKI